MYHLGSSKITSQAHWQLLISEITYVIALLHKQIVIVLSRTLPSLKYLAQTRHEEAIKLAMLSSNIVTMVEITQIF